MNQLLTEWLSHQGIADQYLALASFVVGFIGLFFFCSISYYLTKNQILVLINKWVIKSKNTVDDLLLEHKVFNRIALLIPLLLALFLIPIFLPDDSAFHLVLLVALKVSITFQIARCLGAVLNVIKNLYSESAHEKYLPLNSTIQVIKLVIYLVATILAISLVLNKSPLYLLSGLGALTAVLLLVFQDTIKGLVASIQISANRMLAVGDWIELPKYGADGDVLEIGLNTVKVKNFDNTVTTVPTYALISGSFKNWRDMFNSGGRRIKRTLVIDISSIVFYNNEQIEQLKSIKLIENYLVNKQKDIVEKTGGNAGVHSVNARQLTNVGTFRAYIEAYLKQHEKVHHEMTCMVRQLAATDTGLPLELYFFSNDQNWVNYENIQADIFDHLFAIAPHFDLRIFQHPSGFDWRNK